MKVLARKWEGFQGNQRGFSLVELIVVLAIMSILVGVVGTQVIPYLNRAKTARDIQILDSFASAGVYAYSAKCEYVPEIDEMTVYVTPGAGYDVYTCSDCQEVADEVRDLINRNYLSDTSKPFKSKTYQNIDKIEVTFEFTNGRVRVYAYEGSEEKSEHDIIYEVLGSN